MDEAVILENIKNIILTNNDIQSGYEAICDVLGLKREYYINIHLKMIEDCRDRINNSLAAGDWLDAKNEAIRLSELCNVIYEIQKQFDNDAPTLDAGVTTVEDAPQQEGNLF